MAKANVPNGWEAAAARRAGRPLWSRRAFHDQMGGNVPGPVLAPTRAVAAAVSADPPSAAQF
jgi:hypothetical protein